MKKSSLLATSLLATALLAAGCGSDPVPCDHVDVDPKDHTCDLCGEKVSEHTAGEAEYSSFSADHKCTGTIKCSECGETLVTETVQGSYQMSTAATCTAGETGKYTYDFTKEGFEDKTENVTKNNALDHDYADTWTQGETTHWHECKREGCDVKGDEAAHSAGTATYSDPTADHKMTGTIKCSVCEKVMVEETVTGSYQMSTAATCTAGETGKYTYDFTKTGLVDQVENVTKNNATGHDKAAEWSKDENYHWHACANDASEQLDKGAHVDDDSDFECDVCEKELDGVESVTVTGLVALIGVNDKVTLTANVVAHGEASDAVTWSLAKKGTNDRTSYFNLVSNNDGTATVSTTWSDGVNSAEVYVVATSVFDDTVSYQYSLKAWNYSSAKVNKIATYVGENNLPPYMSIGSSSRTDSEYTEDYSEQYNYCEYYQNGDVTETLINAFVNNGTYNRTDYPTETIFSKDDVDDPTLLVCFSVYYYDGKTYFKFYKYHKTFTSFPADIVDDFIEENTESKFVIPTDGTYFKCSIEDWYISITCDSTMDDYIALLKTNNYCDTVASSKHILVSPDRSLVVRVYDQYRETIIDVWTQEVPDATDWTSNDKTLMNEKLGTVLPFVNAGFDAWENLSYYGYIYSIGRMADAYNEALKVFNADQSFEKTENDDGSVSFTKTSGELTALVVTLYNNGEIRAMLEPKEFNEWKTELIANTLGSLAEETLPVAVGESYKYELDSSNNKITIKVKGDIAAYLTVLEGEDYTVSGTDNTYDEIYKRVAPGQTIELLIKTIWDGWDPSGWFVVEAQARLPEGVTLEFPLNEVKAIIKGDEAYDVVSASGTKFTLTENDEYNVTVKVEGGDKAAFIADLGSAGFESGGMGESYSKDNLRCDITTGDGFFLVNYYLAEKPVSPLGDFWSTFVGDTIENPYTINGPYGEFKLIFTFNNGVIQCYEKGNKTYSLTTLTGDLNGCEEGQLHLTGVDENWNCMSFDFIVEYNSSTGFVTVISNNSFSIAD